MRRRRIIHLVIVGLLGLGLMGGAVRAQEQEAERIGTVLAVDGIAEVRATDATAWSPLCFRDAILLGDTVRTEANSKLKVLMRDESIMTMSEQSNMTFTEFLLTPQRQRSVLSLLVGTLKVFTSRLFGKGSGVDVRTPNAVAGVRGTTFIVRFIPPETTEIFVLEGTVTARNLNAPIDELEAILPGMRTRIIGAAVPGASSEFAPGEIQAIEQSLQLIEQVPEEVTPTEQLLPSRSPRGEEGGDVEGSSSLLPETSLIVVGDGLPLQDVQQMIEAQGDTIIIPLDPQGNTDEPPVTADTSPAIEDAVTSIANIEINFPQP